MKAQAPGKLILSGEHSVIYGAPALATAVSQSVTVSFTETAQDSLRIKASSASSNVIPLPELPTLIATLNDRYEHFLRGDCAIGQLLNSPSDLLFYTLAHAGIKCSGDILINSSIPIGAGMGSSAAVIAALWVLAKKVMAEPCTKQQVFEQVRFCERLQHGRGSAIDAAAVTFGGCVRVQREKVAQMPITLDEHWYIWNSGTPFNTTGETVAAVRAEFAQSEIWAQFSTVTEALESALLSDNRTDILQLIKANQNLLEQIGVVPAKVSNLIHQIEQCGGAAKICGAGALRGDAGGQVLIYLPNGNPESLESLGLNAIPLLQQEEGATFVTD
jgi:mevalonate kinase